MPTLVWVHMPTLVTMGPHADTGVGPHADTGVGPHTDTGVGPHADTGVGPHADTGDYNSNKSPTGCNSFSVYYPDVYLQLNMFRAFPRLSSGAQ